jgi:hypothetical protein
MLEFHKTQHPVVSPIRLVAIYGSVLEFVSVPDRCRQTAKYLSDIDFFFGS